MARDNYYSDGYDPRGYYEDDPPYMPPAPTPDPATPPAPAPTPETPPAPGSPWDTAPPDGNWRQWFMQNISSLPANSASLISVEPQLQKHGIRVLRNASGVAGKIVLPNGQHVDVGGDFSGGDPSRMKWQWYTGSGGGDQGSLGAMAVDPSFLAPFTGKAPMGPPTPTFYGPGEFQKPTADSILQDPSYQFRLDQGKGALENSAAARGTLNSGGTLMDILNYGQKAGSQEYSNIFDRDFGVWNANWNNALTKFRADKDVSDTQYQREWQKYADSRDTWYRNQSEPWSKLYQAATLGAGAAR